MTNATLRLLATRRTIINREWDFDVILRSGRDDVKFFLRHAAWKRQRRFETNRSAKADRIKALSRVRAEWVGAE